MTLTVRQPATILTPAQIAAMIDISAVQASHGEAEVRSLAQIANDNVFIAAHALPHFTALLRSLVPHGGITLVGGPIGFPSGGSRTETKVLEAKTLCADGADEVDLMMNIGRLKSGDDIYVADEIRAVIDAAAPIPVKVIIEVSLLSDDEIRRAARIVAASGAAFVKTGTGWTGKPTTLHHIDLIVAATEGKAAIKASGGIRDLETFALMVAQGVTRFGINTEVAIDLIRQCAALPDGVLRVPEGAPL